MDKKKVESILLVLGFIAVIFIVVWALMLSVKYNNLVYEYNTLAEDCYNASRLFTGGWLR